jgi:Fe-S-cluster-containing dehydrogenase component
MSLIFVGRHLKRGNESDLSKLNPSHVAMAVDIDRCINCQGCEVACLLIEEHDNGPRLDPVVQLGPGHAGGFFLHNFSMRCAHCEDPACLRVCPVNAYRKDENGFVVHDMERCIGCELCRLVCPYGAPKYDERRKQVLKCDFCMERVKQGEKPECAVNCIAKAISFGKAGDLLETIKERSSKGHGFMVLG